ncbi:MAG TPA: hypothetical protein VFQ53_22305 [Kofleriaceae bacterium]|nr:hypothetical protein [Kofleriaceae bacterium]
MLEATKSAEVRRILERYLVEVVERYDLCPWARSARLAGQLEVRVLGGVPAFEDWLAACRGALARAGTRVAMVVAPELAIAPAELRALRDRVATAIPEAGIAEFHPGAPLDLASPARLVPFLRRSPDPLLQLVPIAILDGVRGVPPAADRAHQAAMLGGTAAPGRGDVADSIAAVNHATVARQAAEIEAVLAAITDDRRAAYARVGISASRSG